MRAAFSHACLLLIAYQSEDGIPSSSVSSLQPCFFFFQAEDGIRDSSVTGVQTCALPIFSSLSRRELFANGGGAGPSMQETAQREIPPLVDSPGWKEQGVENLTKSRYAKLRNVPVRAVTIKTGFWGRRRETNVSKSIPTMHDLLE